MIEIDNIQQHMTPVLHDCLRCFLDENADPEEWEYSLPEDQITAMLIHANYFSQKDIETCLSFDVSQLSGRPDHAQIQELFDAFATRYKVMD